MALFIRRASTRYRPFATLSCRFTSSIDSAIKETHTGQKFDPSDYQVARFTQSNKLVNPNFAEKLIAEVPPIPCKEHIVSCDGGESALGHPKVYINLDKPGPHTCGYCGLRYYYDDTNH
ncbi:NADH dehydrogenase iron-sulfur protein 6 mitochondrial [Fasciola hepatica]|uniref:NADH dehydrogenase iron-sulfur protein 6 mitochondrial n=1 Tax=Fasciola hepatica TaxID=6192 RepID=A0A4E0QW62_FASHE|nr:NADH dehydrogenase iron-sulfur protein 6 mitochondrial [Fasciola hepatica]